MLIPELEKKQFIESFCRKASPLTDFARSLRMELPESGTSQDDPNKVDDEPSLLKGLDLDTLPADVRAALEAKENDFKSILKEKETLSQAKAKAEETARNHQSRADRFHERLKVHNLLEETIQPKPDPAAELEKTFAQQFVTAGMKPEAAAAYAKMFAQVAPSITKNAADEVTSRVAPLANTVAGMQVEQLIEFASRPDNDPNGLFQIPEVAKDVREQMHYMAQQGQPVDQHVVTSLLNMSYGKHVQANPDAVRGSQVQYTPPSLNTRGGGGSLRSTAPVQNTNREPIARDQDTQRAAQAVVSLMIPKKK